MRYLLILLLAGTPLLHYQEEAEVNTQDEKPYLNHWDRLKERCGIPLEEEWSYEMKIKYSKQIEAQIKKDKQYESRSKRKNKG